MKNFIELIKHILTHTTLDVVLLGSPSEMHLGHQILQSILSRIHNYIGRVSLLENCSILSQAKLVICHDSAPVHISAALNTPFICISNGNHFGRFKPYPSPKKDSHHYTFPADIDMATSVQLKFFYNRSTLDINTISVKKIIELLQKII